MSKPIEAAYYCPYIPEALGGGVNHNRFGVKVNGVWYRGHDQIADDGTRLADIVEAAK
jgi:hypothetical protein